MNKLLDIYREKDKLIVNIDAMPSWEGFDELIDFLVKTYNALVVKKIDGPDARIGILKIDGHQFELGYNDDFGEEIIVKIAKDIEARLSGKVVSLGNDIKVRISGGESAFLTFWNSRRDITAKIYEKLRDKPYFELLILGGARYSYGLMEIPLEYLDVLLNDLKSMDKSDLK
jgi:hypothetical protein